MTRLCDQRAKTASDPKMEPEKDSDSEIEIEISVLTLAFHAAAKWLSRLLKHADFAADANESKVVRNMIRASARHLHELSLAFRKQYLSARKRLLDGSGFVSILGAAEGGGGAGKRDKGFADTQIMELATAETGVDERTQETQRITKSEEDLAVLFKELNTLVVVQGNILDRIDYNMEMTMENSGRIVYPPAWSCCTCT